MKDLKLENEEKEGQPARGQTCSIIHVDTLGYTDMANMEEQLRELASNGIGSKAKEIESKKHFSKEVLAQSGCITYRFYTDANSVLGALKTQTPRMKLDVLAVGHNCLGVNINIMKFLVPRVPGLAEMDKESGKTSTKLGTFRCVKFTHADRVGYIAPLYVQFGFGTLGDNYRPSYKGKYHIDPKHVRESLTSLYSTFIGQKIGLVMFGADKSFPTPWSIIEKEIRAVCERLDTRITVFVPTYMLVKDHDQLSSELLLAAQSVGYSFI